MFKILWAHFMLLMIRQCWANLSWAKEAGKGDKFMRHLTAHSLHLPHTYVENFDLAYTCINNGRTEPTQIDYMATSAPIEWITKESVNLMRQGRAIGLFR